MNAAELLNWIIFAFAALAAAAVFVAYRRSFDIIQPPKRRTPVVTVPEHFRLAYDTVTFSTADGVALRGWFVPAAGGESGKTVIFCHGWGLNRGDSLKDTWFLAEKGYNLFYFDFRASGESKGAISSIGYLETRDFDAAYAFLRNHRPGAMEDGAAVFGISMGASVALYAAGKYPELKCVIAENAFLSYARVVANWSWMRLKVPFFPFVPLTLFFVRRKLKADPEPYSPAYTAAKVKCPAFFVFGDHDDLVPREDAERLFSLCGSGAKEAWTVPGASHGKCAEAAGDLYREKTAAFLAKHMPDPPPPSLPKA